MPHAAASKAPSEPVKAPEPTPEASYGWSVKNVSPEIRSAATAAAARNRMKIGAFVSRAILTQIKLDQQESKAVAVVAEKPPEAIAPTGDRTAQIADVIALAKQLAEATGEASPGVVRELRGLVMDQARAMRHRSSHGSRPTLPGSGSQEASPLPEKKNLRKRLGSP